MWQIWNYVFHLCQNRWEMPSYYFKLLYLRKGYPNKFKHRLNMNCKQNNLTWRCDWNSGVTGRFRCKSNQFNSFGFIRGSPTTTHIQTNHTYCKPSLEVNRDKIMKRKTWNWEGQRVRNETTDLGNYDTLPALESVRNSRVLQFLAVSLALKMDKIIGSTRRDSVD